MTSSTPNARDRAYWSKHTVLVTGAGGFAASWICKALVEAGATVVGIVRDSPGEQQLVRHGVRNRMAIVHGSIVDYAVVERALNEYEVDTCLHLAAQAIVGAANRSPLSTFESNIKGTWNVLEACRTVNTVQSVVVASSDKAYGDQPVLPYTEDTPLNGVYPYDASKVCTDVLTRSYAVTYGLPAAITRCANIYGGGDTNWSRIVPGTMRSLYLNENPIIRSDGTPERDYLYIEDLVDAYLLLAQRAGEEGIRGTAFNFGSGTPVSALTLVTQITAASGRSLQPVIKGQAKGEIDRQYLDSTRAHKVLGWTPRHTLDEGLAKSWAWYQEYLSEQNL